jgi:hypothetical protein
VHVILNEGKDLFGVSQQILKLGNLFRHLLMLFLDFPAFESRQPAQLHIQNCLGLDFT